MQSLRVLAVIIFLAGFATSSDSLDRLVAATCAAAVSRTLPDATAVAAWTRAATAPRRFSHARTLLALLAARRGDDVGASLALFEDAATAHDWVATSYLASTLELFARRTLALPPAPNASVAASRESAWRGALTRAALLFSSAIDGRAAWLAACGCETGVNVTHTLQQPSGGTPPPRLVGPVGTGGTPDDIPVTHCLLSSASATSSSCTNWCISYPQALYALPPATLFRGQGNALLWLGRESEARHAFSRGVGPQGAGWASGWLRPIQPLPLVTPLPPPVFEGPSPSHCFHSHLRAAERALPAAALEFRTLWRRRRRRNETGGVPLEQDTPPFSPEGAGLHSGRTWLQCPLRVDGVEEHRACAFAPAACALIAAVGPLARPRRGQAKFSVMRRGTRVRPHAGPSSTRLRMHCTLQLLQEGDGGSGAALRVAGGVPRAWREGNCFIFDDAYEHEAWASDVVEGKVRECGVGVEGGSCTDSEGGGQHDDDDGDDDVRAVLIVDLANPLLARRDDFVSLAVSGDGVEPTAALAEFDAFHASRCWEQGGGARRGATLNVRER